MAGVKYYARMKHSESTSVSWKASLRLHLVDWFNGNHRSKETEAHDFKRGVLTTRPRYLLAL